MTDKLTAHEKNILRECAGLTPPSDWSAAIGAAIETLRGRGYIAAPDNHPTQKGWALLNDMALS